MSRVCDLTGKRPLSGNYVSHSHHKTRRKFNPNIQVKRFFVPEVDKWITIKLSTSALKNINKKGIYAYLKELRKQGVAVDKYLSKA